MQLKYSTFLRRIHLSKAVQEDLKCIPFTHAVNVFFKA